MDLADFTGYSLRRQLGSGPAGTVWQVRDRTSGRNAVLKQIPLTAVPDLRRLREDLSLLTGIRHPHIARLMEFRETETDLILISQYVPAGSLATLLSRRGPLSRGELVTLLTPLAEAVNYLHRAHLTHGAITLHNVLLDADGRPVLTDAALHPAPPATDLTALATLSHQAGADPTVFAPALFTKTPSTALPRHLLSLAAPTPIDLAVPDPATADSTGSAATAGELPAMPAGAPDDPDVIRPAPPAGPDLSALLSAPRPKTSDETPGDDDPIALSRGQLAAPPPKPPTAPSTPPAHSEPSSTPTGGSKRSRPNRRTRSRRGRVLRRLPHPPRNTLLASIRRLVRRPPYGTLAAAGLGVVVVLVVAIVLLRSLDAPATAQADPAHPRSTHPTCTPSQPAQPTCGLPPSTQQTTTRPQSGEPPETPSQPIRSRPTGPQPTAVQPTAVQSTAVQSPGGQSTAVQPTGLESTGLQSSGVRSATPEQTAASARPTAGEWTASTQAVAWTRPLQALDAQRAQAFWTLDLEALDRIYVPGSTPWRSDHALLSSYREQQIRVEGLRVQIDSSTIARRTPTTVTLKTTDHLAAGQAVDQAGAKTPLPPGTPTTKLITLTTNPTTKAWRITAITQA
ncbi:protein kinase-like protein [Kribbella rubisoli]|uniref:Protein kinase-like protein n=1 Tax=Kribbella rubisoli TaxID=3075929 RepID=A0A4Q7WPV3_9ACTN|nr:protein kinase [Kribbella rubisoli]RZU12261.1 protein kinase-like protein [Kribbella rubisoli]